jgi:hypothetical protein
MISTPSIISKSVLKVGLKWTPMAIILVGFNSCSLIHYLSIDENRPPDTPEQYNSLLHNLKIDTTNSFQLKAVYYKDSLSNDKYAINTWKLTHNGKASPVQIRLYNTNGEMVNAYEGSCFGPLWMNSILKIVPDKKVEDKRISFQPTFLTDLNMLNISDGKRLELFNERTNYDRVLLVMYNRWTGWYSKHVLKRVRKYIRHNSQYKFLFIKVDTAPKM